MERPIPESVELYIASLQRFQALGEHYNRTDDERTRAMIERGFAVLDQTIEAHGAQPDVQDFVLGEGQSAQKSLEALSELEGILPTEELEVERDRHQQTLSFVAAFATRHNIILIKELETASAPTTEVLTGSTSTSPPVEATLSAPEPTPEPSVAAPFPADEWTPTTHPTLPAKEVPATPERETAAKPLELILIEGDVTYLQIGKRGLTISLKGHVVQSKQKDYSVYRQRALEYMVSRQGEPVRVKDIENALGELPEGRTIGAVMHHVRDWLESLTFRNSRLFTHNKKRGVGSAYEANPVFAMTLTRRGFVKQPAAPTMVVTREQPEIPVSAIEDIADVVDIQKFESSPIPLRAATIFICFTESNADLLSIIGLPVPDKELAERLADSSDNIDRLAGINRSKMSDADKEAERAEVMRQMRAFLSQTTLFEEMIVNTPEDSPIYPFITYLLDLDSEESWDLLLNQVMKAEFAQREMADVNRHGMSLRGIIETITLPNGRIFERTNIDGKSEPLIEVTPLKNPEREPEEEPEEPFVATGQPLIASVQIPLAEPSATEQVDVEAEENGEPEDELEEPILVTDVPEVNLDTQNEEVIDAKPDKEAQRLDRFGKAFDKRLEVVRKAVVEMHAPLEGNVGHLRNYFPWLTNKTIREALENGVISGDAVMGKGVVTLTLEHVIHIGMWRLDSNLYTLERKQLVERIVSNLARDLRASREKPAKG